MQLCFCLAGYPSPKMQGVIFISKPVRPHVVNKGFIGNVENVVNFLTVEIALGENSHYSHSSESITLQTMLLMCTLAKSLLNNVQFSVIQAL